MNRAPSMTPARRATCIVAATLLLLGILATTALTGASRATAQNPDDFPIEASLTASLDVASGAYDLEMDMTITNNSPTHFLTGYGPSLQNTYTDIEVTVEGQQVPHRRQRDDAERDTIEFDFPRELHSGSINFTISARQPAGDLNISNKAYFYTSFIWGGADLAMPLTVQFPQGFDVEATQFGTEMNRSERDGRPTFTTRMPANQAFFGFFEGTRDSELVRENIEVGGVTAEVAGWPGQGQWMNRTTSVAEDSLTALEDVSGKSLPDGELNIVRRNISGVDVKKNGTIELGGDDLDPRLLIERLAPGMFDGETGTPWINAGLAATYRELAITEVDAGSGEAPSDPGGGPPLNEWAPADDTLSTPESPADGRAWNASWLVIDSLYDDLGADGLADVLEAVAAGESAYPDTAEGGDDGADDEEDDTEGEEDGSATEDIAPPVRQEGGDEGGDEGPGDSEGDAGDEDGATPGDDGASTEEWQLLLDHAEAAGATSVEEQFRQYVVTDEQAGMLDDRTEARTRYDELLDESDGWSAPPLISGAMATWDFEGATGDIDTAFGILESADDLEDATFDLGIEAPSIRADYESATDDLAPVLDSTNEALVTTDELLEAQDAADAEPGFVERIGLMGTDLDGKLDDAKASFEAGEFDRATTQANDVVASADDASSTGLQRLLIGLLILVLIAAIIVFAVVWRRRRRRRRDATPESGPPVPGESALAPPPVGVPASAESPAPSMSPPPPGPGSAPTSELPPPPPPGSSPQA